MDKRIAIGSQEHRIAQAIQMLPGSQQLLEASPNESDVFRRRRKNALNIFAQCCEIWKEADQAKLFGVRDKIEPAILMAYDACFPQQKADD
jgi:hypothetical protein